MSNVQRVCEHCGEGSPVESRYCARCGFDSQAALPVPRSSLPEVIGRAALPVLVGAAGLAVRVGWKLLQNRLTQLNRPPMPTSQQPIPPQPIIPIPRSELAQPRSAKRSIHIRSSWSVNNGSGWQQGTSEHRIEIDE